MALGLASWLEAPVLTQYSCHHAGMFELLLRWLLKEAILITLQAYHSSFNKKDGYKSIGNVAILGFKATNSKGPAPRFGRIL